MRVIAGKLKGKKLLTPANDNVRPTLDRIKETLFNIIQFDVADCVFLDLFAGTGGIGIEAYSRGAKEVVFCDASRESLKLVKTNLKNLNIDAFVCEGDFKRFLKSQPPEKYGIIFIDPPYASGKTAKVREVEGISDIVFTNSKARTFLLLYNNHPPESHESYYY